MGAKVMPVLPAAKRWASQPWRGNFPAWLGILVLAQLVFWTALPWLFARSLPLDVVSDGLAWGHEWQWGYYKHPPLPSWTVEVFFDAFGDIGPFLLSQICVAATYTLVFLLGRAMMPARWAAVGTLLLAGVYYFSIPTPEFNHNVAQMPLWAAACLCYFKAWKTDKPKWWLAFGVAAGLGLLTKYSTALLLVVMLAHFLAARGWKRAVFSTGPWLGAAVCLLVISEHVLWLFQNGFPTLRYAAARAGSASSLRGRFIAPLKFLVAQAADITPAVVLAWICGLRPAARTTRDGENLRFLLWMLLGPPALVVLGSLLTGMGARDMWGAPMWNLTGLLIVLSAASRWETAATKYMGAGAVTLFAMGLAGFFLAYVLVPKLENRPSRIEWPDREIAQTFGAAWQRQVHLPLRIVASDGWLGGLVAMRSVSRPSVWIDADYAKAPWITPQAVTHDGVLVLWRIRPGQAIPPGLATLKNIRILGQKSFTWPDNPGAEPLAIGYAILPPAGR
jgi:4-amino-4-deoxy-L-arabinose transferase-like glycosyltransferase